MKSYLEEIFSDKFTIKRVNKQGTLLVYKNDVKTSIYIGWTNLGQSISVDSVIGLRYFKEIEELVKPILKEFNIVYPSFGNVESTYNCFKRCSKNEISKDDSIGLKRILDEVSKNILKIEEECFSLTESINDLEFYITKLDDEKISEFLSNPVLIRKYAISYLVNQDDKELSSMVSEYESAILSYPQIFANHDKALLALDKTLKRWYPA